MFISRDSLTTNSSHPEDCLEKVAQNLVKPNKQVKYISRRLVKKIVESQRMALTLRQPEEKYRSLFENAIEGIFQRTLDGHYLNANSALARIYGYDSVTELLTHLIDGKNQVYVKPERHQELIDLLQLHEQVSEFESEVYSKDGSIIWISESARLVRNSTGTPLYYEGFITEITQRKLLEKNLQESADQFRQQAEYLERTLHQLQQTQSQLIQSDKMSNLGQMVAGVAHEINNPVNFVCGNLNHAIQYAEDLINFVNIYQQYHPHPCAEVEAEAEAIELDFLIEDFPKTLYSMRMGAERIRQIVQSLRNFSRTDEAQMRPTDLHEELDSTLLILNNRIKASGDNQGILLLKEYGELPLVECYSGLLNQVFMNILSNAIDALEEMKLKEHQNPACIRIQTEVIAENRVSIRIADNGFGIPASVKAQIFDPFFTTKPVGKGTGLGLSISHQIVVEKHGGRLNCVSTQGQGTEFVIEIPIKSCQ